MRTKSRLAGALALAGLTALTSACGIGGGGGSSAASAGGIPTRVGNCSVDASTEGSTAISGTPSGTITFQTTGLKSSFGGFFNPLIAQFEKENPGVKVNWIDDPGDTTFTSRMVADANACSLPDVVNLNDTTYFALTKAGFLMNFDAKVPNIAAPYVPSIWKSIVAPGAAGHTALPWYWGPAILTYNKTLLAKAGISTSDAPTTVMGELELWDKVAQAANGKYYAFIANMEAANQLPEMWTSMKVNIVSSDGTKFDFASDPKALAWVTELAKLYKDGAFPKDSIATDADPNTQFAAGTMAFGSTNASSLRFIKQNAPSIYPVTGVWPSPADALGYVPYYGQFISVPVTTKHAAAAVAFAKFLTNAQNQLAWSKDPDVVIFPSTTASLSDPFFSQPATSDPLSQARAVAAQEVKTAVATPLPQWTSAVSDAVNAQIQLAMQGTISPQQALDEAQTKANALLANSR